MNFNGLEKKEIFVERKKHTFYVKTRNVGSHHRNACSTIYVDDDNKIINIFPGEFNYLDGKILTVIDGVDHSSYYNIETGEALFTEYDKVGRCYGSFVNGIALVYDDTINNYHILSEHGEIGQCNWLYRIGKEALLVKMERKGNWSLYNYDMELIKENVSIDYDDLMFNSKFFVACNIDDEGKYYCICDCSGNAVSDKFRMITTKNHIHNFETVQVTERGNKEKRTVDYRELIRK